MSDIRARFGFIINPLCENTRSTDAEHWRAHTGPAQTVTADDINQSITLFVRLDIKAQLQQAEFGTGQTGHEVHLQLPKQ